MELSECRRPEALRKTLVLLVVLCFVCMSTAVVAAKGPYKPTEYNKRIYVEIWRIHALAPLDVIGQADFYWRVTCTTTDYQNTVESVVPFDDDNDDIYPTIYYDYMRWVAIFDVPDNTMEYDISMVLYDEDGIFDDQIDICPSSAYYTASFTFYSSSRSWDGDDYEGDSDGYGHIRGYASKCAEVYFSIMDCRKVAVSGTMQGSLGDAATGNRISGATVEAWVCLADPGTIDEPPLDGFLLGSTVTDSLGMWFIYAGTLVAEITFWFKKDGYWHTKMNCTTYFNGGYTSPGTTIYIHPNQEYWVPEMILFADVDWTHTKVRYEWTSGHTNEITVRNFVAGSGAELSWMSGIGGSCYVDSDQYYSVNNRYPTSCIWQEKGYVSGYWWEEDEPGLDIGDAWFVEGSIDEYELFCDKQDYYTRQTAPVVFSVTIPGGTWKSVDVKSEGETDLQSGLEMSVSVGNGIVSVGFSLEISIRDTSTTQQTASVWIYHNLPDPQTYYFYVEGNLLDIEDGMVIHCWEHIPGQ